MPSERYTRIVHVHADHPDTNIATTTTTTTTTITTFRSKTVPSELKVSSLALYVSLQTDNITSSKFCALTRRIHK